MFLSSIKLVEHLTSSHVDTSDTDSWEKLFEESIKNSLYLPEPDGAIVEVEKNLVNLPSELSESGIYQVGYTLVALVDKLLSEVTFNTFFEWSMSLKCLLLSDTQTVLLLARWHSFLFRFYTYIITLSIENQVVLKKLVKVCCSKYCTKKNCR